MDTRTSEEWQKLCRHEILDPDGWDRKNFQFSWHEEKITREEFEARLLRSTCSFSMPMVDERTGDLISIWKDV